MTKEYTLRELAAKTGAQLIGDPNCTISGVDTLEEATAKDVSFLANPRYVEAMKHSLAGVVCVDAAAAATFPNKNFLVTEHPSRTFQTIVELLFCAHSQSAFTGIHPTAVVHPSAQLGAHVTIGPYAVIDRDVSIGEGTVIGPHVSISYGVTIGAACTIYPGVVIRERCKVGSRVTLQPGAVIGSCGFGYTLDAQGAYIKIEQLGIVVLEDNVEIGANTTIDRSRFKQTIVRRGSKIDNLCQIAHNVEIGEHNAIAAQTGIAGSAKTGKHVALGGQVGILGHVELEDQVMVATRGGVSKRLKKGGKYRGSPAIPINEFQRQEVHVRKLEEYVRHIKELEKRVASLEATQRN